MLVIFIEGADNTGKSTLGQYLANKFNLDYKHCSKPKTDKIFLEYLDMILSIDKPTVFDRGYLGEYVYSQLWRGGLSMNPHYFRALDSVLKARADHPFLVHAHAPLRTVQARCIQENELLLKQDQVQKCLHLFEEAVTAVNTLPLISYNSFSQNPEDVLQQIVKKLA